MASSIFEAHHLYNLFSPCSTGSIIKTRCGAPRSELYSKINDIPMGKYIVSAKHLPSDKALKLSNYNWPDNYTYSLAIGFEPERNFCNRCMAIEYSDH